MNPANPTPSDDETDRLLASRFKDTTPEFEARWVELKRTLRNAPARRGLRRFSPLWTVVFGSGIAVAAVLLVLRSPSRSPAAPSAALEELWAMNEVLSDGTALLDAGNRAELLYLSTEASPPSNLP
jgi:hypothetical protein